jgi:DNA ligase-1
MDTLGKLIVKDVASGIEFGLGTGFDDSQRSQIWHNQSKYLGKIAKYKFQACGVKEKPRFPVFLGWRS